MYYDRYNKVILIGVTRRSEETFLLTFGVFDLLAALHPLACVRAFPVGRAKERVCQERKGAVFRMEGERATLDAN